MNKPVFISKTENMKLFTIETARKNAPLLLVITSVKIRVFA